MRIDSSINTYDVGDTGQVSTEQVKNSKKVMKKTDNHNGLVLDEQTKNIHNTLFQSITVLNDSFSMINTAQNGLDNQINILNDIGTLANQATQTDNQNTITNIAKDIVSKIKEYKNTALDTTYNKSALLYKTGDADDDLSIIINNSFIEMETADTLSLSTKIESSMKEFTTNPQSRENIQKYVENGIDNLTNFKQTFQDKFEELNKQAKNSFEYENQNKKVTKTIQKINYPIEVADFNKTNLLTQAGSMTAAQAHANTERNIHLLR